MKISDNFELRIDLTRFGRPYCTVNGVKVGYQTSNQPEAHRQLGVDILKGWAPVPNYPRPFIGQYTVDADIVRTSKNLYFVRLNGYKMGRGLTNAKLARALFRSVFKVDYADKIHWVEDGPTVHEEE